MVDCLVGVATRAFAGRCEFPLVQGTGRPSYFGSCSVERHPVFSLKISFIPLIAFMKSIA